MRSRAGTNAASTDRCDKAARESEDGCRGLYGEDGSVRKLGHLGEDMESISDCSGLAVGACTMILEGGLDRLDLRTAAALALST